MKEPASGVQRILNCHRAGLLLPPQNLFNSFHGGSLIVLAAAQSNEAGAIMPLVDKWPGGDGFGADRPFCGDSAMEMALGEGPRLLPAGLSLIVTRDPAFWSPSVPTIHTDCFPARLTPMGLPFVSLAILMLCPYRWRGLSFCFWGSAPGHTTWMTGSCQPGPPRGFSWEIEDAVLEEPGVRPHLLGVRNLRVQEVSQFEARPERELRHADSQRRKRERGPEAPEKWALPTSRREEQSPGSRRKRDAPAGGGLTPERPRGRRRPGLHLGARTIPARASLQEVTREKKGFCFQRRAGLQGAGCRGGGYRPTLSSGESPRGPYRGPIYDAPLGLELKSREVTWFV